MKTLAATATFAFILLAALASTNAATPTGAIVYDVAPEQFQEVFRAPHTSVLSLQDSIAAMSYRFDGDTLKILVVLIDWTNRPHTYSHETIDSMLFSHNVFAGGSVADYYDENSYNQAIITGVTTQWYTMGFYSGYFDFESMLTGLDNVYDFSEFDGNNDGFVDAIIFVRSGDGQEFSHDPNDIWSHAIRYPPGYEPGPFDGKYVNTWNTSPETYPLRSESDPRVFSGLSGLNSIGVFTHELGHSMGLPDLYDYDSKLDTMTYKTPGDENDHPMVDWCQMGYGGYGILSLGSNPPSHLSGWCKKELGWIEPIVLDGTYENLVIKAIETTNDSSLYKVWIDYDEDEYFLLEYRNPSASTLFDKTDSDFSCYFFPNLTYGADTLDRGLMITHVHEGVNGSYFDNDGTPAYPHYAVAIEDAGYNPTRDMYSNPEGNVTDSAQWWYPYETRRGALFSNEVDGQNEFSPMTIPSSDGYEGPSGVTVRVDSIVGDRLYAYVDNTWSCVDSDGDLFGDPEVPDNSCEPDNCPDTYNPDQLDSDSDGLGDLCDNCPDIDNPDQTDLNANDIGDACEECCGFWTGGFSGNTNCSTDGKITLSDISTLIDRVYISKLALCCEENGNTNGSLDGEITLSDITRLIDKVYISKDQTASCLP